MGAYTQQFLFSSRHCSRLLLRFWAGIVLIGKRLQCIALYCHRHLLASSALFFLHALQCDLCRIHVERVEKLQADLNASHFRTTYTLEISRIIGMHMRNFSIYKSRNSSFAFVCRFDCDARLFALFFFSLCHCVRASDYELAMLKILYTVEFKTPFYLFTNWTYILHEIF